MRFTFLALLFALSSSLFAASQPNIVIMLVDDMGVMDTSLPFLTDAEGKAKRYPLNDWYRTPNMERLAAKGIRFNNFCAMSVCSPTRISIMTGQNAARHRATNWINPDNDNAGPQGPPDWNWKGLHKDDVTLPGLLEGAGYRTIHVGKGHFGPRAFDGADPANLGFDINVAGASIGAPGSYYGAKNFGGIVDNAKGGKKGKTKVGGDGKPRSAVPGLEKYHGQDIFLTEALTIEAKAHLSDAVKEKKPFYLYFAQYAVHAPFNADPRFADHYKNSDKSEQAQAFAALIEAWTSRSAMSSIISTPSESPTTRSSSSSVTTAVMHRSGTSTPSPAPLRCAAKRARTTKAACACRSSPPGQRRMRTTSIKSACPIAVNAIQSQQAAVYDMFPTILGLTGVEAPAGHAIDGKKLDTLLTGKADSARDEKFLMHYPHSPHRTNYFTSFRDGEWKVIYHYFPTEVSEGSHYQLYNLKDDPFEQTNLATTNPAELKRLMQGLIAGLEAQHAVYPVEKGTNTPVKPQMP
jgi:arylsulfatase A-like enzyme